MAVRISSASQASSNSGLGQKSITRVVEAPPVWVRNPSWPACDANVGDEKMVLLHAVFSGRTPTESNLFAFVASGGNFTVDFGDGTTTNYTDGTQVNYQFSFDSPALSGTDAPVTLNATTDTVDRTAHGYTNGMTVTLYNVTSTPEVSSGQSFYVVNATANAFQISATSGGSPILFSIDGAATLLPYKIATVAVTPQAGQSITSLNLDRRHNTIPSISYSTGLLDVCIAFSTLTTITMFGSPNAVFHRNIERFRLLQASTTGTISLSSLCREMTSLQSVTVNVANASSTATMFTNCANLTYAPEMSLASVTNASSMFSGCKSLYFVPSYTMPSCTTIASMFLGCSSLRTVGALTVSSSGCNGSSAFSSAGLVVAPTIFGKISNCSSIFNACVALKEVPPFDTSLASEFSDAFSGCVALEVAPMLNTQSAQFFSRTFNGCRSLISVPLYNTQSVGNMDNLFANCGSLEEVPLFNTQNVSSMNGMFNGCSALRKVPLFNTQNVTNMSNMFVGCTSLVTVPHFNTQNVSLMSSMFFGCTALTTVPRFNTSRNVTLTSMFSGCSSLKSVPLFDTSLCTAVNTMFQNCTALTTVPAFNLSSATNMSAMFSGCTALTTVPSFSTNASGLITVSTLFSGCSALRQVGSMNFNGVTSATNFTSAFQNCSSLSRLQASGMRYNFSVANCMLSKGSLEELFDNLATASATVTVTGNFGIGASATSASSTSTAGSTVINTVNTSGVAVGMLAIGTNCPVTSTVNGNADVTTDTITAVAHGLNNGRKIAFSSLSGLGVVTGVSVATIYYVVNATADTFQVASTVGGAPINLGGTSGAVTFRYPNYVVSVNPGVSITMDAPQARTGTSTITFRALDISSATLKNWSVTL